jgi:hypothetical protein
MSCGAWTKPRKGISILPEVNASPTSLLPINSVGCRSGRSNVEVEVVVEDPIVDDIVVEDAVAADAVVADAVAGML